VCIRLKQTKYSLSCGALFPPDTLPLVIFKSAPIQFYSFRLFPSISLSLIISLLLSDHRVCVWGMRSYRRVAHFLSGTVITVCKYQHALCKLYRQTWWNTCINQFFRETFVTLVDTLLIWYSRGNSVILQLRKDWSDVSRHARKLFLVFPRHCADAADISSRCTLT
jgi:hypothetical protein